MSDAAFDPVQTAPAGGSLINRDLAPTGAHERTWNLWHIASLWVGMSVCIPTYMLSAAMVQAGMRWWEALAAVLIGNAIVWVPLVINAHAGTRYGIPFPVYARAAFGTRGAHLPAILRALVACGWFGIQTWIGGMAIHVILGILWPGWSGLGGEWAFMGHSLPQYLSFLAFWGLNVWVVWRGTESIRVLETVAAPLLIAAGLALLFWAISQVGGLGTILRQAEALSPPRTLPTGAFLLAVFLPWVTAMVGYWATLSLNIPDFTRYARSQKDQMAGQALGLLTTMPLFAFIGVAVTSATVILYGEAIWNPVELAARIAADAGSALLGLLAMAVLAGATLTTNIAANVVGPAFTFANLAPSRVSFRTGGLITGAVGILIFPWLLLDMYQGWLISYSGLLGAAGGVILCDYVLVRRTRLRLEELYREDGAYTYRRGVNPAAVLAVGLGAAVALAGRLHPSLHFLFDGAWFSATFVSFASYAVMMRGSHRAPRGGGVAAGTPAGPGQADPPILH